MRVIFIRGLPGTGKTIVSEILGKIFLNSEVICVDKFKLQAMKKGEIFEEGEEIDKRIEKIAYKKTLGKLNSFYEQNRKDIIIEGVIIDRSFYDELRDFINKTKSKDYWFRLLRPLEKLLEVEAGRKRKIRNSKEDFDKLREDIENCKIENEYWIKNDDLALSIKKILDIYQKP